MKYTASAITVSVLLLIATIVPSMAMETPPDGSLYQSAQQRVVTITRTDTVEINAEFTVYGPKEEISCLTQTGVPDALLQAGILMQTTVQPVKLDPEAADRAVGRFIRSWAYQTGADLSDPSVVEDYLHAAFAALEYLQCAAAHELSTGTTTASQPPM